MQLGYADQANFARNVGLLNGCPEHRFVTVPRAGTGAERVAIFYDAMIKALTDPLTSKEKESGIYAPSAPPRIIFEGTLTDAQEFLQQTVLVENCRNCPIAKYTDGLPVVVPTEQAVAEMLTGTSHSATEMLDHPYPRSVPPAAAEKEKVYKTGETIQSERQRTIGAAPAQRVVYTWGTYQTTIEKAAIIAVMAGCKPEYLPVVLAIACTGGNTTNCPGTSSMNSSVYVVSGPIAKEIGMNAGQNALDVGNRANMTLGRAGALVSINMGACITGAVRSDSGNPLHSICFAEDVDGLPTGWEGLNEQQTHLNAEYKSVNYTKNESTVGKVGGQQVMVGFGHAPGSHRQMWASQGGMARNIQAQKGLPETAIVTNFLESYIPGIIAQNSKSPTSVCLVMHNQMAYQLYKLAGFQTKKAVYAWLTDIKNFWTTAGNYRNTGWWDYQTDEGRFIESTSGKPYLELPADYKLKMFGSACIIVSDSFQDEHCYVFGGGIPSAYPIDPWR